MKRLLIIAALFAASCTKQGTVSHRVEILAIVDEDEDYVSVIFIQDGREWGLEGITPAQFDSLQAIR